MEGMRSTVRLGTDHLIFWERESGGRGGAAGKGQAFIFLANGKPGYFLRRNKS